MRSPSHLIASKLQSPSSSATFEPHNSKCTLTYSSLSWTSHTTNNLSRSDRCNSPPLSALGNLLKPSRNISHNNLPRSVRSKLPPCVPRVPYSRDISHNKEPPQISLVQITSLCAQSSLLKAGRDISHNKQPPWISPAQLTPLCAQGTLLKPGREISQNEQPPQISPVQLTSLSALGKLLKPRTPRGGPGRG